VEETCQNGAKTVKSMTKSSRYQLFLPQITVRSIVDLDWLTMGMRGYRKILHRRYSRVTVQKVTSELRFKLMVIVNLNLSLRRIDLDVDLYSGVLCAGSTAGYCVQVLQRGIVCSRGYIHSNIHAVL